MPLAKAQVPLNSAGSLARAGCYAASSGWSDAMLNQAGLGWTDRTSLTVHHMSPYLLGELGPAGCSVKVPLERGGLGTSLSTSGLEGLRSISGWLGCGLRLGPDFTAGVGLHIHLFMRGRSAGPRPGLGWAAGWQWKPGNHSLLGGHIRQSLAWNGSAPAANNLPLEISLGMAYSFFSTATWYGECQSVPGHHLCWKTGLELFPEGPFQLLAGVRNTPLTLSLGLTLQLGEWWIRIACSAGYGSGMSPASALSHVF